MTVLYLFLVSSYQTNKYVINFCLNEKRHVHLQTYEDFLQHFSEVRIPVQRSYCNLLFTSFSSFFLAVLSELDSTMYLSALQPYYHVRYTYHMLA